MLYGLRVGLNYMKQDLAILLAAVPDGGRCSDCAR
jgi:hypothetical protein